MIINKREVIDKCDNVSRYFDQMANKMRTTSFSNFELESMGDLCDFILEYQIFCIKNDLNIKDNQETLDKVNRKLYSLMNKMQFAEYAFEDKIYTHSNEYVKLQEQTYNEQDFRVDDDDYKDINHTQNKLNLNKPSLNINENYFNEKMAIPEESVKDINTSKDVNNKQEKSGTKIKSLFEDENKEYDDYLSDMEIELEENSETEEEKENVINNINLWKFEKISRTNKKMITY